MEVKMTDEGPMAISKNVSTVNTRTNMKRASRVDVDELEKSDDLRRDFGIFLSLKREQGVTGKIASAGSRVHDEV